MCVITQNALKVKYWTNERKMDITKLNRPIDLEKNLASAKLYILNNVCGLCIKDGVWKILKKKECFNLHGRHDFVSKTSADLATLLCRELINLYNLICALKVMQIRKVRANKNKSRTTKLYPQKAVPGITFP